MCRGSLTCKGNEVVSVRRTSRGINVFSRKCLCTAQHQQDLSSNVSLSCSRHKVHPNAKFVNAYVVFKEECDAQKALKE